MLTSDKKLTLTTDQSDYQPGSTALLTASNSALGSTLAFQVFHTSDPGADGLWGTLDDSIIGTGGSGHDLWYVTDGGAGDLDGLVNGVVQTNWYVDPDDSLGASFLAAAWAVTGTDAYFDMGNAEVATTAFTDSQVLEITNPDSYGMIGGAWFEQGHEESSAGTGVIDSFVRIQASGNDTNEEGYNTDYRPVQFDENTDSNFTDSVLLENIPIVSGIDVDGDGTNEVSGQFFELRLDLNQNNSSTFIILDSLQIYLGNAGNLTGFNSPYQNGTDGFGANANLVYSLDGTTANGNGSFNDPNTYVVLNDIESGSGSADYFFYLPVSSIDGIDANVYPYLYLYSSLGYTSDFTLTQDVQLNEDNKNDFNATGEAQAGDTVSTAVNGGFEEWNIVPQPKFEISGYKWLDTDGDAQWDGSESGLADWTIYLDNDNVFGNGFLASTTTNTSGQYAFTMLPAGTYYVYESTSNPDWINTYNGATSIAADGSIDYAGDSGVTEALNFGNFELFDVSGTKYTDFNGDGTIDEGDSGLAGVTVFIDMDGDEAFDNTIDEFTSTDVNGDWAFSDLDSSYAGKKVYEVLPDGYVQTLGELGYGITGTSGADQSNLDFANFELFDVSGYKWRDDGDGTWEGSEAGLGGWTIYLDNDNNLGNGFIASVTTADGTTDANHDGLTNAEDVGYYEFTNQGPGTYYIYEDTTPTNWTVAFDGSTSFAGTSGLDQHGDFGETELLNFGNHELVGSGTRTPGFWKNWASYWDGERSNDPKQVGPGDDDAHTGFAEHDVLTLHGDSDGNNANGWQVLDPVSGTHQKGLLVGDWDLDGITDAGEHTVFFTLAEALAYVDASQKQLQDGRFMLARDVVASWLNYLAGNEVGTVDGAIDTPKEFLMEGIDWLRAFTVDESGAGSGALDGYGDGNLGSGPAIKTSSLYWNTGVTAGNYPGSLPIANNEGDMPILAGNAIHQALDEYNNSGEIVAVGFAPDGDLSANFLFL